MSRQKSTKQWLRKVDVILISTKQDPKVMLSELADIYSQANITFELMISSGTMTFLDFLFIGYRVIILK